MLDYNKHLCSYKLAIRFTKSKTYSKIVLKYKTFPLIK